VFYDGLKTGFNFEPPHHQLGQLPRARRSTSRSSPVLASSIPHYLQRVKSVIRASKVVVDVALSLSLFDAATAAAAIATSVVVATTVQTA